MGQHTFASYSVQTSTSRKVSSNSLFFLRLLLLWMKAEFPWWRRRQLALCLQRWVWGRGGVK